MRNVIVLAPLVMSMGVLTASDARALGTLPSGLPTSVAIAQSPLQVATGGHFYIGLTTTPSNANTTGGTWSALHGTVVGGLYTAPAPGFNGTDVVTFKIGNLTTSSASFPVKDFFPPQGGLAQASSLTDVVVNGNTQSPIATVPNGGISVTGQPIAAGLPIQAMNGPTFWQAQAATEGQTGYIAWPARVGVGGSAPYGVVVRPTTNAGVSWGPPVVVGTSQNGTQDLSIAIDQGDANTVYLSYNGTDQHFATSRNGAQPGSSSTSLPFSTPAKISRGINSADVVSPRAGEALVFLPGAYNSDNLNTLVFGNYGQTNPLQMNGNAYAGGWNSIQFVTSANAKINVKVNDLISAPRAVTANNVSCLAFDGMFVGSTAHTPYVACMPPGADAFTVPQGLSGPVPTKIDVPAGVTLIDANAAGPPVAAMGIVWPWVPRPVQNVLAVAFAAETPPPPPTPPQTAPNQPMTEVYVAIGKQDATGFGTALKVSKPTINGLKITDAREPDLRFDYDGVLWLTYRINSAASFPPGIAVQKAVIDGQGNWVWSDAMIVTQPYTASSAKYYHPTLMIFGHKVAVLANRTSGCNGPQFPMPCSQNSGSINTYDLWSIVP